MEPSSATSAPPMRIPRARTCVGHMRHLMRRHTFRLTACRRSLSPLALSVSRSPSSRHECLSVSPFPFFFFFPYSGHPCQIIVHFFIVCSYKNLTLTHYNPPGFILFFNLLCICLYKYKGNLLSFTLAIKIQCNP